MSLRVKIGDLSDYVQEYDRLQKKITAKIAAHQGQCGEDGDRGEDATGLVTTSSSVATFLCNLMQFIEGPDDVAIDEDTQATPRPTFIGTYTSNVGVNWYIEETADAQYVELRNQASQFVELHWVDHFPDYETKPTYAITLAGNRQSNGSVIRKPITIRINDVDDTPPILTGSANVSVPENTRFVATYTVNEDVDWNLGGTDAGVFEKVDETDRSVTIQFQVAPDYEVNQNEYNITLSATDKSVNANVASIDIRVTVTDVDDTAPTIEGNFQPIVQENTLSVGTYTSSEVVTWTVTGADAALFMLDGGVADTVDVYFINTPDFEDPPNTYNINLIATDAAGNSRTQALTITVTDVDDTAPVITGDTTKSMAENVSDKTIGTYTADEDITLWELTGAGAASAELINSSARSTTLQFKATTVLNYDNQQSYTMTLRAIDNNNNSTSITITVTIKDVDQEHPIVTGLPTVSVPENTTVVGTYQSNEDVTWEVDNSTFTLTNSTSRSVQVEFATAPDFEGNPTSYRIILTATDTAGNHTYKTIDINVTDVDESAPVILSGPTAHTIAETSTTLVIGTYTSSEDIATWTLSGTDANDFTIEAATASAPATLALKASPTKYEYNVSVTATDLAGNTSVPTALVVTVDPAPVISGNTSVDKLEGATDKSIGVYTANEDIDAWGLDGDDANDFTFTPDGARHVTLALKESPDYETKTQYNVILKATDAADNVGMLNIQVNVLNDPSDDPFSGVLPVLPSGYVLLDASNNLRGMMANLTIEAATDSAPAKLVFKYNDGTNYRTYEYHAPGNRYEYFDNADTDLYYITVTRNPDLTYHLTYTNEDATSYDPVLLTWMSIPNKRTDIFINENVQTNNTMAFSTAFNVTEWKLGGADADKFEWINTDASTAQLQFKVAPDFEAPASADGGVYRVQLQGVAGGITYQQDLQIQVINATEITGPAQLTLSAGAASNQTVATYTTDNGTSINSQGGYHSMHTWAVLDDTGTFTWEAPPQQAWLGALNDGLVDAPYLFGEVALQLNAPAVSGTYSIQMAANTFDGTYNQEISVGSDDVYFTFHNEGSTTIDTGIYNASQYSLPRAIKNRPYGQQITLSLKPQISVLEQTIGLTSVVLRDILNLPNGLTFKVLNEDGTEVSKTELTDVPVPSGVANMQAYVLTPGTTNHATYAIEISGTPTESQGNIQLQLIIRGLFAGLLALNVPTPFDKDVVATDPTYTITTQMLALTSNPFIGPLLGGISNAQLESTINVLLPRFKIEATDTADLTHDVTVTVNDDNVITVSAGQLTPPFYTFTANGNLITELQANTTYVFKRQNNATSHPFRINDNNAITGTSTVTVTTGAANSQIPWLCTAHASIMNGSFNVV